MYGSKYSSTNVLKYNIYASVGNIDSDIFTYR